MKITEIISEAAIGTNPKRPARTGSRPDRGHEATPRYVTDRKTGKQYGPEEEFDKLKNSPEFQAQMKRMSAKEGFDYTMKDLGNDAAGFPSNHSLKHKILKRISPEHRQLYKDKMNNTHDSDQLMKLFHVAKARGHVIDEQGVAEGSDDKEPFDYAKWKASNVKSRKPRGYKDAEAIGQQQRKIDKERKEKGVAEAGSNALADTAKRLTDPKDGQVAKLRAAGDKKRQGQIQQQQSYGRADENKAPRSLCVSSKPDEDLGASQLSSCKSQGLRARDGNKSHKLGKTSKSRVKVGGKRIKGNKYGGPLPDWS